MDTDPPLPILDETDRELLQETIARFKYKELTGEQEILIGASILGYDVLGVLPTGSGKSACYIIPGIVKKAKTIVVSPLIALQEDQVGYLQFYGVRAFALHSNLQEDKKEEVYRYFSEDHDEASFLYLSPELLLTEAFHSRFSGVQFDRIAVDEAHCISTWGNTFRPEYQRIRIATQRMKIPHCAAFTATVDRKIEKDIRKRLPLKRDFVRVAMDPMRPNLEISVKDFSGGSRSTRIRFEKKLAYLVELLDSDQFCGPTIVYCNSRSQSASVYKHLSKIVGLLRRDYSCHLFHAKLPYEMKQDTLFNFTTRKRPIVVATTAFGMGVNRANVRQIIHFATPITLIDYAQQIGRGGRDGEPTLCTTMHSREEFLEEALDRVRLDLPSLRFVENLYAKLRKAILASPEKKRSFDVQQVMRRLHIAADRAPQLDRKDLYHVRLDAAFAILQRARVLREDGDGFTLYQLVPGSPMHEDLITRTEMHRRMQVREQERLALFFGDTEPSQEKLWSILQKDD